MKNKPWVVLAFLFVVSVGASLAAGGVAHADDSCNILCEMTATSLIPFFAPTVTSNNATADEREIYVGQLKDDAAAYVAAGGVEVPTALLESAFANARTNSDQMAQLSDLELATLILKGN